MEYKPGYNMLNQANKLTFIRILAIPIVIIFLYFPNKLNCLFAMLVFILAALTDMFDGLMARKYGIVSSIGKFLDPLADKLLINSVLIMLVGLNWVPAWMVILIIAREILVTGIRAIAADQGVVVPADNLGKLKTVFQILAICPLVLHFSWLGTDPRVLGMFLLWIALLLTLFSGANYIYRFVYVMRG